MIIIIINHRRRPSPGLSLCPHRWRAGGREISLHLDARCGRARGDDEHAISYWIPIGFLWVPMGFAWDS